MEKRNLTYRLYPKTPYKANRIKQCMGARRYVWNYFLAKHNAMYEFDKAFAETYGIKPENTSKHAFSFYKEFKDFRDGDEAPWLRELPSNPIRHTLKHQADAWAAFFAKTKGRPRFKSKGKDVETVTFPDSSFTLRGNWLRLQRIGWVRVNGSDLYKGCQPTQVTINEVYGKFHATITYDVPDELIPKTQNGEVVGVDLNAGQFATSRGPIVRLADHERASEIERLEKRKRHYQRKMARQQQPNKKQRTKGSNRHQKTRKQHNRVSTKITNIRKDWQHQETTKLAINFQYIGLEDLNIKGMTASAKGTVENPGKNVAQKRGLNRAMLEIGPATIRQMLAYKAEVILVNPKYTSQKCAVCGHTEKDNRPTQSKFHCLGCGHTNNADVNAALNIENLARGIGVIGRGGTGAVRPPGKRQENSKGSLKVNLCI